MMSNKTTFVYGGNLLFSGRRRAKELLGFEEVRGFYSMPDNLKDLLRSVPAKNHLIFVRCNSENIRRAQSAARVFPARYETIDFKVFQNRLEIAEKTKAADPEERKIHKSIALGMDYGMNENSIVHLLRKPCLKGLEPEMVIIDDSPTQSDFYRKVLHDMKKQTDKKETEQKPMTGVEFEKLRREIEGIRKKEVKATKTTESIKLDLKKAEIELHNIRIHCSRKETEFKERTSLPVFKKENCGCDYFDECACEF